jgi:hypothetical protein
MPYDEIDYLLATFFSADVGLPSELAISRARHYALETQNTAACLAEVKRAFADPDFSWSATLANHAVYKTADEAEAREFARVLLIEKVMKPVDRPTH